jgi:hypothetical protein
MTKRDIAHVDISWVVTAEGVVLRHDGSAAPGAHIESDSQGHRWAIGDEKGPWCIRLPDALMGLRESDWIGPENNTGSRGLGHGLKMGSRAAIGDPYRPFTGGNVSGLELHN